MADTAMRRHIVGLMLFAFFACLGYSAVAWAQDSAPTTESPPANVAGIWFGNIVNYANYKPASFVLLIWQNDSKLSGTWMDYSRHRTLPFCIGRHGTSTGGLSGDTFTAALKSHKKNFRYLVLWGSLVQPNEIAGLYSLNWGTAWDAGSFDIIRNLSTLAP